MIKRGYFTTAWNARDPKPTLFLSKTSLHPKKLMLCMWLESKRDSLYDLCREDYAIVTNNTVPC